MELRDALEAKGFTQRELAERLGVSPQVVNHWVSGRQGVPAARLAEIREALGWVPEQAEALAIADEELDKYLYQAGTPLAWLLRAGMSRELAATIVARGIKRQEHPAAAKVQEWALLLGVSRADLLEWAGRHKPMPEHVVLALCHKAGYPFYALGQHIARPITPELQALEVEEFLEIARQQCYSVEDVVVLGQEWEPRREYLDYDAARHLLKGSGMPKGVDMDEQWQDYAAMIKEFA